MKIIYLATLLGFVLGPLSSPIADDRELPDVTSTSVSQLVSMRQQIMKEDGKLLRDASKLSGVEAVAAAATLRQNIEILETLFPEGSVDADSKALPEIWSEWSGFEAYFVAMGASAEQMATTAAAGDAEGYMAALKSVAKVCGDCHSAYRAP